MEGIHNEQSKFEKVWCPVEAVIHQCARKIVYHDPRSLLEIAGKKGEGFIAPLGIFDDERSICHPVLAHAREHTTCPLPWLVKRVLAGPFVLLTHF
jgi:hypothetical protein